MKTRFGTLMRHATAGTVALCAVAAARSVSAQAPQTDQRGDILVAAEGAEGVADFNVTAARRARGFQLFAQRDAGGVGLHSSGNFSFALDNYSPCDSPLSGFCAWNLHPSRNLAVATFQFFEVLYFAGAPPSQWIKIRNVAPDVGNAKGGGYTALMNFGLFSGRAEWGPRDNSLGALFSGVTSTNDGSCRDNTGFSNGFYPTGLPLLAASNCPDTWADGVWGGDRSIAGEAWKTKFDADGGAFEWNFWQVPDDQKRDSPFLGTNFSTYGESSDHYAEILAGYGAAIPGGTGDPAFQGYPLGLVWHFESFNFGVPSLSGVVFYRALLINRSEDVYGTGVDYDSLYAGLAPGTGGALGQQFSNYYLPDISTALYHQSAVQGNGGPCGDASRGAGGGIVGCHTNTAGQGYLNGGNAIMVLKSPIGDLRNKLFTRTTAGAPCGAADPFCNPGHPLAGDTITFNHGHMCGFGGCWADTHNVNDRRSFGVLSSTAANALDGRGTGELAGTAAGWRTYRNFGWPAVIGEFNHYTPGVDDGAATWDYDHDGTPNTLYYDTCHIFGCVVTDWDTLPGGHWNAYGNVGGVLAAGPFSLGAGDTTAFTFAFVGDADSTLTWAGIGAALDLYLNFYLAPESPPAVTIASSQITTGTAAGGGNQAESVRLFFTETAETWVDPFLLKLADDVEASPPTAPLGDLLTRNPALPAMLRARAADNLEQIEIYKSCNGGNSFTSDADCDGDPASDVSGNSSGFGWEAYAILNVDAVGGDIPNAFTDNNVQGGRTYLYVIVAKSRGATFLLDTPTGPDTVGFAPSIRNVLSRSSSDPNVISVYVPASNQAGFVPATVTFNESGGEVTVPFTIGFAEEVIPGNYKIQFGNQFIVERDSNTTDEVALESRVIAQRVETVGGVSGTVVRTSTTTLAGTEVVPVAGSPASTASATVGSTVTSSATYSGLGFVVTSGTAPVFVSQTLTGDAATPTAVFALSAFPGFTVSANNGVAGSFNGGAEVALRGDASKARFGTEADTVSTATVTALMAQFREQNSDPGAYASGRYRLSWTDEAYGLPNGIVLNFNNPAASGRELQAALAARTVGDTGRTDAETAALLGVAQADLVPLKLPFSIRNVSFDRDVEVAMERRAADTYRLGSGNDTIRVEIPADQWIPGDVLHFMESVTEDSLDAAGDVVLDGSGNPVQWTRRVESYAAAVIGCDNPSPPFCNPTSAQAQGQSGYLPVAAGDAAEWEYYVGFDATTLYDFDLIAPIRGEDITVLTDSAMNEIRVVPNPFVVFSQYQANVAESRILFTNVPPTGTLRIYTVSGQFLQQVTWTPADLSGAGDLFYDLKSRENIDIASGLYIWVLTAPSDPTNGNSTPITARGKFVIIRGQPR
ncbi:MAG TPA: hypothetical protein VGA37_03760 [Gemmatimonadales bacterium]